MTITLLGWGKPDELITGLHTLWLSDGHDSAYYQFANDFFRNLDKSMDGRDFPLQTVVFDSLTRRFSPSMQTPLGSAAQPS
jgi:hypothetical protein